jgi:hypothetical protein
MRGVRPLHDWGQHRRITVAKSLTWFALGILLALGGPTSAGVKGDGRSSVPGEEYAVYDAVLGSSFARKMVTFDAPDEIKMFAITNRTSSDRSLWRLDGLTWQGAKPEEVEISSDTLEDYEAKNATVYQLERSFDLGISYSLVRAEWARRVGSGTREDRQAFYRAYPDSGGVVTLSRVGFDPTRRQALVLVQHTCGDVCGTGHYVVLVNKDGRWQVYAIGRAWTA